MDGFSFAEHYQAAPVASIHRVDQTLLKLASLYVDDDYEKSAIVPAGGGDPSMGGAPPGGAPPDPSMGGAPPAAPDPSMGGAPPQPPDPTMVQAVAQAVMQQLGQGGAAGAGGGMAGKPTSPKKAEDAIRDAKIFAMHTILCLMAEQMGISLPPSVTLGDPPAPEAQQAAQQEHQNASMVASDPASTVPAQNPSGIQPMSGMDASGPIGKMASFGDTWPIERPVQSPPTGNRGALASRFRELLGA